MARPVRFDESQTKNETSCRVETGSAARRASAPPPRRRPHRSPEDQTRKKNPLAGSRRGQPQGERVRLRPSRSPEDQTNKNEEPLPGRDGVSRKESECACDLRGRRKTKQTRTKNPLAGSRRGQPQGERVRLRPSRSPEDQTNKKEESPCRVETGSAARRASAPPRRRPHRSSRRDALARRRGWPRIGPATRSGTWDRHRCHRDHPPANTTNGARRRTPPSGRRAPRPNTQNRAPTTG